MKITVTCRDIYYRGHPASISCWKTALVEIDIVNHVGIEAGKKSGKMAYLIHRDTVKHEKIVIAVASIDMKT